MRERCCCFVIVCRMWSRELLRCCTRISRLRSHNGEPASCVDVGSPNWRNDVHMSPNRVTDGAQSNARQCSLWSTSSSERRCSFGDGRRCLVSVGREASSRAHGQLATQITPSAWNSGARVQCADRKTENHELDQSLQAVSIWRSRLAGCCTPL